MFTQRSPLSGLPGIKPRLITSKMRSVPHRCLAEVMVAGIRFTRQTSRISWESVATRTLSRMEACRARSYTQIIMGRPHRGRSSLRGSRVDSRCAGITPSTLLMDRHEGDYAPACSFGKAADSTASRRKDIRRAGEGSRGICFPEPRFQGHILVDRCGFSAVARPLSVL